jgi:hypothetical protein
MVRQRIGKEEQIGRRSHIVLFLGSGQIMEKGPKGTRIDKVLYWVSDALDGFKWEAMEKEIAQQVQRGMYSIIERSKVPQGAMILPAVWALRCKWDVRTGAIKKYKACCNIDGSRMIPGEHYDLTYAPVAGWTSVWLLRALVLLNNWYTV